MSYALGYGSNVFRAGNYYFWSLLPFSCSLHIDTTCADLSYSSYGRSLLWLV